MKTIKLWSFFWLFSQLAGAKEITINQAYFHNAPDWLKEHRLQAVVDKVQKFLEWDIRRIHVYYYSDRVEFNRKLTLNFKAAAFFRRGDSTLHLGPEVDDKNFDRVFTHELVHAIFYQKYKGSIPPWLEEGFANYIGKTEGVDYAWLKAQVSTDVTQLTHPNLDRTGAKYHYQASTALIEMIAKKCSLHDLLKLSVGAKMTTYLSTYCEIKDVNTDFTQWVKAHP